MATFWFIVKILAAILFVLTGGIVSFDRRWHWALVLLAALIAIGGAIYLFRDIYMDCADIRWCRTTFEMAEVPPSLSIRGVDFRQKEGDTDTKAFIFEVRRSGSLERAIVVRYAVTEGTADAEDFGGSLPEGEVRIRSGDRTELIVIRVSGDRAVEDNEDFVVRLIEAEGADIVSGQTTGIILNDDKPARRSVLTILARAANKNEGNEGAVTEFTFEVRRSGARAGLTLIDYAVELGSADAADFGGTVPSGQLIFERGERSKPIVIPVTGDDEWEADETFSVVLSNPRPRTVIQRVARADGVIRNDDQEPVKPVEPVDTPTAKPNTDGTGESEADQPKVAVRAVPVTKEIRLGNCRAETPVAPAGDAFRDCDTCPLMVPISPGSYCMGTPGMRRPPYEEEMPIHRVDISRAFAVGRFEVTWDEWAACVWEGGCDLSGPERSGGDNDWGKGARPVIEVTWRDAKAYTEWLSAKTGKVYRLLSESEWEYVARAGTTTLYSWGDMLPKCDETLPNGANYRFCDDNRTRPVTSFQPNPFTLHHVHGNVTEWVEDCVTARYGGRKPDTETPRTDGNCRQRMLRGGSWRDDAGDLRSAKRFAFSIGARRNDIGFRVAREIEPDP